MRYVLVDTSVWISYFRANAFVDPLSDLIDSNRIVTNDLILAELIPSIVKHREKRLHELLLSVKKVEVSIDWSNISAMQTANLRRGNNNVGIPDLIIVENAIDNHLLLFENDKHFRMMKDMFGLELFDR
jgi:predicted nucleic acid-binding protein